MVTRRETDPREEMRWKFLKEPRLVRERRGELPHRDTAEVTNPREHLRFVHLYGARGLESRTRLQSHRRN